jgi:uncharacterized protein
MKKSFVSFFIVIIFLLVGFLLVNSSSYLIPSPLSLTRRGVGERSEGIKSVKIAGQNIKVDLAITLEEQEMGLGGRSELKENEGMLFIFDQPGKHYFWMKNMNFSIDIIWLDENLHIVYLKKDIKSESYPETFGPDVNTKYVLEVRAGFSEKNNLKEGDSVLFVY